MPIAASTKAFWLHVGLLPHSGECRGYFDLSIMPKKQPLSLYTSSRFVHDVPELKGDSCGYCFAFGSGTGQRGGGGVLFHDAAAHSW